MNQIKIKVIESYNILAEYAFQLNEGVQLSSPIVTKLIAVIPHIIVSTRLFCTDPGLDTYLEDEHYSELVVHLMETLNVASADKKLTDCFLPEMKNIVVQICCNLIKLSKSEAD